MGNLSALYGLQPCCRRPPATAAPSHQPAVGLSAGIAYTREVNRAIKQQSEAIRAISSDRSPCNHLACLPRSIAWILEAAADCAWH